MKYCNCVGQAGFLMCNREDGQCIDCRLADLEQWNDEMTEALNKIVKVSDMGHPAFSIACLVLSEIGVDISSPENP